MSAEGTVHSIPKTTLGIEYTVPARSRYAGPALRNLGLSAVIHAAAITALMNVSLTSTPPELRVEDVHATELRLNGKLYYVSKIDGSNSAGSKSAAAAPELT